MKKIEEAGTEQKTVRSLATHAKQSALGLDIQLWTVDPAEPLVIDWVEEWACGPPRNLALDTDHSPNVAVMQQNRLLLLFNFTVNF